MKNNFPNNLYFLRKQRKWKQSDVAEKLGTTQRKISYWEKGKIEPDLDDLLQLAEIFDVSLEELLKK